MVKANFSTFDLEPDFKGINDAICILVIYFPASFFPNNFFDNVKGIGPNTQLSCDYNLPLRRTLADKAANVSPSNNLIIINDANTSVG